MITITEIEFEKLSKYVKSNYGINLSEKKKTLVVGRLQNILVQNNFDSFSEYYDYVVKDTTGEAVVNLLNKITTNHTFFMREADHFEFFKEKVLPFWTEQAKKSKDLRIWSAGCSSGEEPYTLAMIISDYLGDKMPSWDARILATDISMKSLKIAKEGIYKYEHIKDIPDFWKKKYFKMCQDTEYMVSERIRNNVIFRIFNLMNEEFPFKKKFHVIYCRNVMIYFDNETKNKLIKKFYDYTETGGYLFIGHSESINREESGYKYIMPAVYRKE
ncbi:UNVERIFIED_CONTAM: chemotaxis protein methyltransferase CheR [Acetivibrio alkalicellulosi]